MASAEVGWMRAVTALAPFAESSSFIPSSEEMSSVPRARRSAARSSLTDVLRAARVESHVDINRRGSENQASSSKSSPSSNLDWTTWRKAETCLASSAGGSTSADEKGVCDEEERRQRRPAVLIGWRGDQEAVLTWQLSRRARAEIRAKGGRCRSGRGPRRGSEATGTQGQSGSLSPWKCERHEGGDARWSKSGRPRPRPESGTPSRPRPPCAVPGSRPTGPRAEIPRASDC